MKACLSLAPTILSHIVTRSSTLLGYIPTRIYGKKNIRNKTCKKVFTLFALIFGFSFEAIKRNNCCYKTWNSLLIEIAQCMHILNHENLSVNFSSNIFSGDKRCKSSCTSLFCFKIKININWTFSCPQWNNDFDNIPSIKVLNSLPKLEFLNFFLE